MNRVQKSPRKPILSNPIRTCVGCGQKRPQPTLLRLVRTEEGRIVPGKSRLGRGAWLCEDSLSACLAEARRTKGLARAMRARVTNPVTDEDWSNLHQLIDPKHSVAPPPLR